jgi:Ca2+/Na+ antiporter
MKMSIFNIHLSVTDSLAVTAFNVVLVCIFGWGIVHNNLSAWNWLIYVGLSFLFYGYIHGTAKWKNEAAGKPDIS